MSTEAILFGVSCGLTFLVVVFWRRLQRLYGLCRRVAEHLGNENHTGIRDLKTHGELWEECERAGWTNGGKER